MKTTGCLVSAIVLAAVSAPSTGLAEWQPHVVRQLNGKAGPFRLPARFQIVTESWNRVVAVPYIFNITDNDRVLMLVSCD